MESKQSSKWWLLTGYLSAVGANSAGALSCSCVQALEGAVPDFQLSVARSIVQLLLYLIGGKLVGAQFTVSKVNFPGLLYLSAAYMAISVGLYGSMTYLPLIEATGVAIIAMIIAAFLQSRLLFSKEITKGTIIASLVCAVGVLLVAQPAWLFKPKTDYPTIASASFGNVSQGFQGINSSWMDHAVHSENNVRKSTIVIGYLLSIFGGTGTGASFEISSIILQGVKPIVKATYAAFFCTLSSVIFMFYLEDPVLMVTLTQWMFVFGHAVLSAVCSFLTIQAGHYVPGPSISVVFSFEVVTMLVAQYTIMHSVMPGRYNWIEVDGCIVITLGASIPGILDILVHRAKANEVP